MAGIKCKRFFRYEDVHDSGYGVGGFFWLPAEKRSNPDFELLLIWLPDGVCRLHCHRDPYLSHTVNGHTVWQWDGNRDSPTLSPSILNPEEGGWHGFLRSGVLEGC